MTRGTGLQLPKQEAGAGSYDISPDGAEIAFTADSDRTGIEPNADVYVIPAQGGAARNLTAENKAGDGGPLYSPDGRFLAFGRQVVRGFYGDRVRLVLHDRKAGTNRVVTEAFDRSVGDVEWAPDAAALFATVDDAAHDRVFRIDATTGAATPITKERSFSALALSADGKVLLALRQGFTEPPTLVRVDPASGAATKLSTFNDALFEKVAWGTYESVTYKGAGGKDIQMWVNYPPGFDRTKKWPVYLILHGGPHNGGHRQLHLPLERAGVLGLGLRDRLAQLPRLVGVRPGLHRLDQPRLGHQALRGHDHGRRVARRPALGRPRPPGRGRGQLRRLPRHAPARAAAPFKALVAHAGVYNLYSMTGSDCGAEQAALRRVLGEGAGPALPEDVAALRRRRTSRPRPWSSTAPSTTVCPTATASRSGTCCSSAGCRAGSSTTRTRTTGS